MQSCLSATNVRSVIASSCEAIQDHKGRLDCFVARAPRNDGEKVPPSHHADSHDPPPPGRVRYRPRGRTISGSTKPCAKLRNESAPCEAQLWNGLSRKVARSSSHSLR